MLSELVRVIFVLTELRAVICEYLIRQAPLACTFIEDLYAVLCRRIGKLSCTCYESRGIILVEDVPLPFVSHPIGVPQTVAVAEQGSQSCAGHACTASGAFHHDE